MSSYAGLTVLALQDMTVVDITSEKESLVPKGSYGQGNILINAAYAMPLRCKRLILLGLSKIEYKDNDLSDEALSFVVTAKEWREMYEDYAAGTNGYVQLKRAAMELMKHETGALEYLHSVGNGDVYRWFSKLHYNDGEGYVDLRFSREIAPNLKDLVWGGNYTPVDMEAVCLLTSTYAIRLYEQCRQFRYTGIMIKSVDDFRQIFRLENKYQVFGDLRKRVIQKSVDEIIEHDLLKGFKFTVRKKGTKVTHLVFTFKKEPR